MGFLHMEIAKRFTVFWTFLFFFITLFIFHSLLHFLPNHQPVSLNCVLSVQEDRCGILYVCAELTLIHLHSKSYNMEFFCWRYYDFFCWISYFSVLGYYLHSWCKRIHWQNITISQTSVKWSNTSKLISMEIDMHISHIWCWVWYVW